MLLNFWNSMNTSIAENIIKDLSDSLFFWTCLNQAWEDN